MEEMQRHFELKEAKHAHAAKIIANITDRKI
jgi:hypothetical protein